jgi:hypothetical protein
MSDWKNYEKYLRGEWYPGCPVVKSPWREAIEADFAARGVSGDSRPIPHKAKVTEVKVKRSRTRTLPKPEANKKYQRERRSMAIKDGNCTDCFKVKSMAGKTTCRECQDIRNARTMKNYYAKKAA